MDTARVDDGSHVHATGHQASCGGVNALVIGEQHQLHADSDTVVGEVTFRGAQHHHPGSIVVAKSNGAFQRAHGDDEFTRTDVVHRVAAGQATGLGVGY